METLCKTLWSTKTNQYVHFDLSPLTDEVIWGYSDIPQLMSKETTMDMLVAYLGKETITPEGTELRTVQIDFVNEQKELVSEAE